MTQSDNKLFQIVQIIDAQSITQNRLIDNIVDYFHPEVSNTEHLALLNRRFREDVQEYTQKIKKWGKEFLKGCPSDLQEAFIYISRASANFSYGNLIPYIVLNYGWKLFFDKFPKGRIILINYSDNYYNTLWKDLDQLRISEDPDIELEEGYDKLYPQEYTGFLSTEFPYFALNFMSYGIPTRILGYADFQPGLILYYIPDITVCYKLILSSSAKNYHVIDSFIHVFSDNLSQNMPIGETIALKEDFPIPTNQMDYYLWFIEILKSKVKKILHIQDPKKRELIIMTFNRAMTDCMLCVIHILPYLSKLLFFSCLDKLANFFKVLENGTHDADYFKKFFDTDFLTEVLEKLRDIPCEIGKFFQSILKKAIYIIESEELTPEYMRAMRNSVHGYNLKERNLSQLMARSADVNNSIVNLVIPLTFYFLLIDWNIT